MKAQHTPGPWVIKHGASDNTGIYKAYPDGGAVTPCKIAEVLHHGEGAFDNVPPSYEDSANAHLIAASPELLEAVMLCVEHFAVYADEGDENACLGQVIINARSAIAKAKGESA